MGMFLWLNWMQSIRLILVRKFLWNEQYYIWLFLFSCNYLMNFYIISNWVIKTFVLLFFPPWSLQALSGLQILVNKVQTLPEHGSKFSSSSKDFQLIFFGFALECPSSTTSCIIICRATGAVTWIGFFMEKDRGWLVASIAWWSAGPVRTQLWKGDTMDHSMLFSTTTFLP